MQAELERKRGRIDVGAKFDLYRVHFGFTARARSCSSSFSVACKCELVLPVIYRVDKCVQRVESSEK